MQQINIVMPKKMKKKKTKDNTACFGMQKVPLISDKL